MRQSAVARRSARGGPRSRWAALGLAPRWALARVELGCLCGELSWPRAEERIGVLDADAPLEALAVLRP